MDGYLAAYGGLYQASLNQRLREIEAISMRRFDVKIESIFLFTLSAGRVLLVP